MVAGWELRDAEKGGRSVGVMVCAWEDFEKGGISRLLLFRLSTLDFQPSTLQFAASRDGCGGVQFRVISTLTPAAV